MRRLILCLTLLGCSGGPRAPIDSPPPPPEPATQAAPAGPAARPFLPTAQASAGVVPDELYAEMREASERWTEEDETRATSQALSGGLGFDADGRRVASVVHFSSGMMDCGGFRGVVHEAASLREARSDLLIEDGEGCIEDEHVDQWREEQVSLGLTHGENLVWASVESGFALTFTKVLVALGPPLRGYMLYADGAGVRLVQPDNGQDYDLASVRRCDPARNRPGCDCIDRGSDEYCECCPLGISIEDVVLSPTRRHLLLRLDVTEGTGHSTTMTTEVRVVEIPAPVLATMSTP